MYLVGFPFKDGARLLVFGAYMYLPIQGVYFNPRNTPFIVFVNLLNEAFFFYIRIL